MPLLPLLPVVVLLIFDLVLLFLHSPVVNYEEFVAWFELDNANTLVGTLSHDDEPPEIEVVEEELEEEDKDVRVLELHAVVEGTAFQSFFALLILINTVILGAEQHPCEGRIPRHRRQYSAHTSSSPPPTSIWRYPAIRPR